MAISFKEVYQRIKELEGTFPVPAPQEKVVVGTFNGADGSFTGKRTRKFMRGSVSDVGYHPVPGHFEGEKMIQVGVEGTMVYDYEIPAPKIEGYSVALEFRVANPSSGGWEVSIGARRWQFLPTQLVAVINIGLPEYVNWTISTGNYSCSDKMYFQFKKGVGVGVFTIPVIPLHILYEPPKDQQGRNCAFLEQSHKVSSEVRMSFRNEQSTTTSVSPSKYQSVQSAKSALGGIADAFGAVSEAGPVVEALRFISAGLGEMSAQETTGTINEREDALRTEVTLSSNLSTAPNQGGPGVGDLILYLENVRWMWVAYNGAITLTYLGFDRKVFTSAGYLNQHLPEDLKLVFKQIDPFMEKRFFPSLPPERFEPITSLSVQGASGCYGEVLSYEVIKEHTEAKASYTMRVEDYSPGFLSILGMGVTEDETIMTNVSQTMKKTVAETEKFTVGYNLCAGSSEESYTVDVFFDKVYGSFAFRGKNPVVGPLVGGNLIGGAAVNPGLQNQILVPGK